MYHRPLTNTSSLKIAAAYWSWEKLRNKEGLYPGSRSVFLSRSPGPSRPRKEEKKAGISRVGTYRTKYRPQDLQKALQAVSEKRMGASEAEVPRTTLQDRLYKKSGQRVRCPQRRRSSWIGC